MDTYETFLQNFKKSTPEQKEQILKEKKSACICPQCPTYTSCSINEKELGFCLLGQSFQCISFDKGCICNTCPVHKECGFTHKKFCLHGDEKGQRYSETWITA